MTIFVLSVITWHCGLRRVPESLDAMVSWNVIDAADSHVQLPHRHFLTLLGTHIPWYALMAAAARRQASAAVAGGARHALRGRQVRARHDGRPVPALVPDALPRGPLRRPVPPVVPAQRGPNLLHDAHSEAGCRPSPGVCSVRDRGCCCRMGPHGQWHRNNSRVRPHLTHDERLCSASLQASCAGVSPSGTHPLHGR